MEKLGATAAKTGGQERGVGRRLQPHGKRGGTYAGLQKWTLVNGTWQLDYVLRNGLVGQVDTNLTGPDGAWPNVTTVGLRNLAGVVNGDQVTLWATTSTSSTSGDNGAESNEVVLITHQLPPPPRPRSRANPSARWWG